MNDEQLLRYSRQIMLPQMGIEGQTRLNQSRALIIGLGGLGSPVALYLAAAGVGHLTLVDDDIVDLSNLQRQIIHTTERIGLSKVESAKQAISQINPLCTVRLINERLERDALLKQIDAADVVVDASDNFHTRFLLNELCVHTQTPLVSGAAIRMEGQVTVFHNRRADSPCYHCLYKDEGELDQSCSQNGVLAPLVGIIGSIQALEAIKVLTEMGTDLCGRLLLLDAETMEWRQIKLRKDPACPVCQNH